MEKLSISRKGLLSSIAERNGNFKFISNHEETSADFLQAYKNINGIRSMFQLHKFGIITGRAKTLAPMQIDQLHYLLATPDCLRQFELLNARI